MKKSGILALAIALIIMSFTKPTTSAKKSLKVDVKKSTISWKGYKPTGSHSGTISLKAGSIEMIDGRVIGGSFTTEMSSIKENEDNLKVENHLKSKDFFEIEVYPTAIFEITGSENKVGITSITGNLTIKDVTKEVIFSAIIEENEVAVSVTSETFQINRADFNVKYKSKTFFNNLKEKFINDEFDLQVTIVATK